MVITSTGVKVLRPVGKREGLRKAKVNVYTDAYDLPMDLTKHPRVGFRGRRKGTKLSSK